MLRDNLVELLFSGILRQSRVKDETSNGHQTQQQSVTTLHEIVLFTRQCFEARGLELIAGIPALHLVGIRNRKTGPIAQ